MSKIKVNEIEKASGSGITVPTGTSFTVADGIAASSLTGTVAQANIADQAINEAKLQISNAPTNGHFLSAQSGNTGGLTWAEAGGGMNTLLSTTNISNAAQVDIEANIDSTYSKYYFKLSKLFCATDNAYLLGRVKLAGSGNYQTDNGYEYVNTDTRTNGTTFDNGSAHDTGTDRFLIQNNNGQGNASTESFDFDIWLSNPADTAIHKFVWGLGQGWRSEHAMCQHRFFGSYKNSTSAIVGFRFYMNTGNITSGTIQLYGVV